MPPSHLVMGRFCDDHWRDLREWSLRGARLNSATAATLLEVAATYSRGSSRNKPFVASLFSESFSSQRGGDFHRALKSEKSAMIGYIHQTVLPQINTFGEKKLITRRIPPKSSWLGTTNYATTITCIFIILFYFLPTASCTSIASKVSTFQFR